MKINKCLFLSLFMLVGSQLFADATVANKSSKSITFRYVGGSSGGTSPFVTLNPGDTHSFGFGSLEDQHIDVPTDQPVKNNANLLWWAKVRGANKDWGFSYRDTNNNNVYFIDDAGWNAPRLYFEDGTPVGLR